MEKNASVPRNLGLDNIAKKAQSVEAKTEANPFRFRGLCSARAYIKDIFMECWTSSEIMFSNRVTILLLCGPIALIGGKDGLNVFGESTCFALAGLALIPCAERLSFVTEEIAAHTNETFGALLNATFGNAPELLISTAALRSGFYRVVQLTSLGSILTNLLLVFGVSSFIGGLRWQVQQVRLTSGNVSVGMLLIATTGLVLPAALKLNDQEMFTSKDHADASLMFSRFNAAIMISMYFAYLIFQLVTHKEEFEDSSKNLLSYNGMLMPETTKNIWCNKFVDSNTLPTYSHNISPETGSDLGSELEMTPQQYSQTSSNNSSDQDVSESISSEDEEASRDSILFLPLVKGKENTHHTRSSISDIPQSVSSQRRKPSSRSSKTILLKKNIQKKNPIERLTLLKRNKSDSDLFESEQSSVNSPFHPNQAQISFRAGVIWLLTITVCISAISDIIVDTIDGFAQKSHISEVFTSIIIIPFFSNIAEQVSAVIFAYRNKMDLCVGITAGSAIQISLCVLPGSVLIGWAMDRSMSLFFNGFETCCLVMAVLSVSVILQGGTTNWLVGLFFISTYLMIAAGFWYHAREDLSTDQEIDSSTGA